MMLLEQYEDTDGNKNNEFLVCFFSTARKPVLLFTKNKCVIG